MRRIGELASHLQPLLVRLPLIASAERDIEAKMVEFLKAAKDMRQKPLLIAHHPSSACTARTRRASYAMGMTPHRTSTKARPATRRVRSSEVRLAATEAT